MTDSRIDIADCDDIHRVNAKSDFDFILKLFCGCAKDGGEPQEIGWPGFDWTARFWTWSPANAYTVSCIGGVCTNCFNDNGRIHVVFDNHRLTKGRLRCDLTAELPNAVYPDGSRREVLPQPVGIELVSDAGDCGCVGETEVELTLPAVYLTAYDLAVRNGYQGTLDEYVAYVNRFPSVVETSDAVMRLVSDFDTGKAAIADALTRQGAETAPDEPMAAMADKVLGLRLAVEGQPGIVDQSLGGRLPYTDLLNLLRNNRRADLPYCYAVRHALESVMLAGADAYLCSDGFFSEEGGEHVFTDFVDRWVIYYFRNADYLLTAPTPCLEAVALNGRPQFSLAETKMASLRSYTEEEYGLEAGLTSMRSALTEIVLSGVVRTDMIIGTSGTRSLSLLGLQQVGSTLIRESDVRSLHLPSIKDLGSKLAYGPNSLESVSLPALETLRRDGCIIEQCNNVKKMDVSKLSEIGGRVAFQCAGLTELTLPSLTTISGGYVASSCAALTELTLPSLTTCGYPYGEFYMFGSMRGIKADMHVHVPRLERMGCYVTNSNLDESDKDIHIHFGAPQGGVLNVRANYAASHVFVSVEPGFRSRLDISRLTAMTAGMLREIISNLADNTDNATIPVIFGAANLAKLTEEDIAVATSKNYSLS